MSAASWAMARRVGTVAADNLIGYLVHGKPLTPLNPEVAAL